MGKAGQGSTGWRRYAPVLALLGAYLAIRYLVRNTVRHQLSGDEYGIAMGFFVLGLFSAYYVPYALPLWKNRPGRQGPPGPTPG
ncbi:MAG: hypothetical protein L6E13_07820 [Firmicutes bacterium]|nr:hypothetical protein [Bacillota bacterium]